MVLILDGYSEIGAHVRSRLFDLSKAFKAVNNLILSLIRLRHLFWSRLVTIPIIFFIGAQHVLSYHLIQVSGQGTGGVSWNFS